MNEYKRLLKNYLDLQQKYVGKTILSQDEVSDILAKMKSRDGRSMADYQLDRLDFCSALYCGIGIIFCVLIIIWLLISMFL